MHGVAASSVPAIDAGGSAGLESPLETDVVMEAPIDVFWSCLLARRMQRTIEDLYIGHPCVLLLVCRGTTYEVI